MDDSTPPQPPSRKGEKLPPTPDGDQGRQKYHAGNLPVKGERLRHPKAAVVINQQLRKELLNIANHRANEADAEDAVQTAFLGALEQAAQGKGSFIASNDPKHWLRGTTARKAHENTRKTAKMHSSTGTLFTRVTPEVLVSLPELDKELRRREALVRKVRKSANKKDVELIFRKAARKKDRMPSSNTERSQHKRATDTLAALCTMVGVGDLGFLNVDPENDNANPLVADGFVDTPDDDAPPPSCVRSRSRLK